MGKNQDPGSGINIPDPQHCTWQHIFFNGKKGPDRIRISAGPVINWPPGSGFVAGLRIRVSGTKRNIYGSITMISCVWFWKRYDCTHQGLCGHCSPCDRSAWPASWPCLSPPSAPWSVLNQRNLRKSKKFLNFDTDPDPTFHLEADPDPDPVSYLSDAPLRPMVHRPSTSPFWASTNAQFWLRYGFRILPLTLMRIRIQFFALMRIRTRLPKMIGIHADPDPQHCWKHINSHRLLRGEWNADTSREGTL